MSTWIEAQRSSCGPLCDAASVLAAHWGVERDPPAGVAGLVALTRALQRHRASPAEDERDRVFVELAGAYLAVVLRQALAQGRHVEHAGRHGLSLGPAGYFDPFAAVLDALEADDVRGCLASWVREAEAEAEGRGPYARAERAVLAELRGRYAGVRVVARHGPELELLIDGRTVTLDLRRVAKATRGERADDVGLAARKLLSALPVLRVRERPSLPDAKAALYPRLVAPGFFADLGPDCEPMLHAPLVPGIELACVLREPGRARFVAASDLRHWDAPAAAVLQSAVDNLAAGSAQARLQRRDGDGVTLIVARTGDGLDSARLLLPGLHDVLAPELGSPFAAAVPHRDALLACPLDSPRSLRALRATAAREHARAAHAISPELLRVSRDRPLALLDAGG